MGYCAKFSERYAVGLYALAIEGNHLHQLADYPNGNRAAYQRDLNACVARAVPRYVPSYPGGGLWSRRYSGEYVPGAEDIEEYFFYVVLQPVQDGLVDRISEYPGYNCFCDAVNGISRKFKVVDWAAYNEARRWRADVRLSDYVETVELRYRRLPGYEQLSPEQYRRVMYEKLEARRQRIIAERQGRPAAGRRAIQARRPGSRPRHSKTSQRYSHRPRVLSVCPERRARARAWYFDIYWAFREASRSFRAGNLTVNFPPGTYRPHLFNYQVDLP